MGLETSLQPCKVYIVEIVHLLHRYITLCITDNVRYIRIVHIYVYRTYLWDIVYIIYIYGLGTKK
jgi:hypothetical protein